MTQKTGATVLGYLSETQVAEFLGYKNVATLRNARSRGEGPPYTKLNGKTVVYPEKDLHAYLAARTVRPSERVGAPTLARPHHRRAAARRSLTAVGG